MALPVQHLLSLQEAIPGAVVKATTILRSPVTTSGEMIIPSITIAGFIKTNFKISGSKGLNITREYVIILILPCSGVRT